jgi:hypothetical protein
MIGVSVQGVAGYAPVLYREFFKLLSKVHTLVISELAAI